MARWRRWVFEVSAPLDEFSRLLQRGLTARGIDVRSGDHFDLVARGFGCRAYAKLAWADAGVEVLVKLKGGLFASPPALERVLLEAGRDAQARLTNAGDRP
ncbi:MAG: hypothetical protein WDA16_14225 [Candidatus Thermoplasmatota archaeon]